VSAPTPARVSRLVVCVALLLLAAAGGRTAEAPEIEWLIETGPNVLELRLAHNERRRPDGGVLRVDSNRRVVTWEGIPGELGCRQKLEAPFSSVRAVRDEPDGVIRLEISGQPRDRWVFVPLPHAAWLSRRMSILTTGLREDQRSVLTGPDGLSMPVGGSAAFAGPQLREDLVPGEITADVRLAATRIRDALGRQAVPSVELYEALNGKPVDTSIADILANAGAYEGRAVRVRGTAELLGRDQWLKLVDEGAEVRVRPQPEVEAVVRSIMGDWQGQEVEVAGLLKRSATTASGGPSHEIAFWEYLGPEPAAGATAEVPTVSIQDVTERPEAFAGQTVRIVGRFRGRNLGHDLPEPGPRSAWVVKSGRDAIWVTGHKPSGHGFSLNPDLERDTQKWLEVTGRVQVARGTVSLRASRVALSPVLKSVWQGPRLQTAERPDVVFTLPLLDEDSPSSNARFLVQFSTYMDGESFEGRVRLRYTGSAGPGGELRRVRWSYDDTRRTLIVDPGEPLRPGASVELLLLPGIVSSYASPLVSASGEASEILLRWHVQG
jgi:hypothetical protein